MHGLIFAALRGYLKEVSDPTVASQALGETVYAIHESHPDELFLEALERASSLTAQGPALLLHEFGVFTGEQFFPNLFPMLYESHVSAMTFLHSVDAQIHSLVRKAAPEAVPPGLAVHTDGDTLIVAYSSKRRLCIYLSGLLEGTARHYHETSRLEEETCMLRGDPVCLLRVEVGPAI